VNREARAKANIEAAVREAGADWTVVIERPIDGYTLRLGKGSRLFVRSAIDESVLEDEWSGARDRLIDEARRELEEQ
jgi:hypothetical protein